MYISYLYLINDGKLENKKSKNSDHTGMTTKVVSLRAWVWQPHFPLHDTVLPGHEAASAATARRHPPASVAANTTAMAKVIGDRFRPSATAPASDAGKEWSARWSARPWWA